MSEQPPEEESAAGGFFIGQDPDGKKYIGVAVSLPLVNLQVILCDEDHAAELLKTLRKVVNEVLGRPDLHVVKHPGLYKPSQPELIKPGKGPGNGT